jgi:hypothetical protein
MCKLFVRDAFSLASYYLLEPAGKAVEGLNISFYPTELQMDVRIYESGEKNPPPEIKLAYALVAFLNFGLVPNFPNPAVGNEYGTVFQRG